MLTPKGLNYYPELVFVTRRKSANRMKRSADARVVVSEIAFFLEKGHPKTTSQSPAKGDKNANN